jgi:SAM-dependent methyltransferase
MHPDEYKRIYAAEQTHWWYRGLRALVLTLLRKHLTGVRSARKGTRGPSILDAGCGTGGMAAAMSTLGQVTSLDLSRTALDFCRLRGLSLLVEGSVGALPFRPDVFDAVVSLDVLYHTAVVDDQRAVCELVRVMRPGGVLVLNVPAYDWLRGPHDLVIDTARRYSRGQVRALLTGAGLDEVWLSHWDALLFPAAVAVRIARRLVLREARSDIGPVHPLLNRVLGTVLTLERGLLRLASIPFGLSIIAVARRAPEV